MNPAAALIVKLRNHRKLSQKTAAILLECKPSYLCALEKGRIPIQNEGFIKKISEKYRLSEEEKFLLKEALLRSRNTYKLPAGASIEMYEFLTGLFLKLENLNNKKIRVINEIIEL